MCWQTRYMESEFYLANSQQAFLGSMELLKSSDIWIGDMGAKHDTIFSKEGEKNERESSISTHGIAGDVVGPDKELDIECIHCNQYINTKQKGLTLAAVSYMKICIHNLCSLTEMLKCGWKMNGDKKAIMTTKGSMGNRFDIIIPTKNGALFCACLKHTQEVVSGAIEIAPK